MWVEAKLQTKIQKYLIDKEWFMTINLIKTNRNWIPDLQILIWDWKSFFIEVKKRWWMESKLQEYRRKQLNKMWYISLVVYSWEDFIKQYLSLIKKELRESEKSWLSNLII